MSNHIPHDVVREDRADGSIILRSKIPLGPVARNTGEWLHNWAEAAADRVALGERSGAGWRELSYAEVLQSVRALAASLSARGLGEGTPIAIISQNSVNHGLIALAAQYIGAPVVPLAEQYSLIHDAHPRLVYAIETARPVMVYAEDAALYGPALALDCFKDMLKIVTDATGATVPVTTFDELLKGDNGVDLDAIHAKVGPETLAKIMFTSGSTSNPKGVLTTHKMLCVNQTQIADCLGFLRTHPPRLLDWLPWNHVFGGSHNFNMMLANGGSFYIDNGKPTNMGIDLTIENVRNRMGTLSFNVPVGYARLVSAMKDDQALKEAFFKDLELTFYAGASLPLDIWQALEKYAMEVRGELPLMVSSWGMTETAPAAIMVHEPVGRSGIIGVPMPGVELKLIPDDEARCELRVKGPNIMEGYFEEPRKTAEAFDADGYLITGDAVKFVDPDDMNKGLSFDGRVSDDFKLLTGTWVRAASLRMEALRHFANIAADVVITGQDKNEVGAMIFPDPEALQKAGLTVMEQQGALVGDALTHMVRKSLAAMAEHASGSSTRVNRVMILAAPPSVSEGEITAKGSLNNRKILTLRKDLLERLYSEDDPAVTKL
ncbi:feruloyl-CoA synthase [Actibacterium sp.]|uniref:feruloyl-CoA synthase n=1 Tax=Actibacterium sp. TaxID=1872125 RepID=UPI003563B668